MALNNEEKQLLQKFKNEGKSIDDFKKFLYQKRQDDFLNSMKQKKEKVKFLDTKSNNSENKISTKNNEKEVDKQGWDFGVNISEKIGNFGEGIKFKSEKDDAWYTSVGKFIGNIPGNALQIVGGVGGAISNPAGTVEAITDAGAAVIENGMNKFTSTEVGQNSFRWLGDKLGVPKEVLDKNLEKVKNGGIYLNERREVLGKGLDKFGNDLKNDFGGTVKKLAVENPVDVLSLGYGAASSASSKFSKVAKAADSVGDVAKAEKYTKYASYADKTSDILNPINVAKNVYVKPTSKILSGVGSTLKTLTSKISGLNPETLTNIVKNPELFRKAEKGFLTKENVADKVVKSIDQRIAEVGELGKKYENIKSWTGKIDTTKIIPRKILEKYDIKVTAKGLDFGKSAIGDTGNMNAITKAFEIIKSRKLENGKDVLNLRRALDDVINYKSEATDLAKNIVRELRTNIDKVAKEQIPELNLLDKKFGFEIGELQKIKKYIFSADGTLKDDYIQKISNLTGKGKEKTLERIKKLVPEIEHEINALKALADVKLASGNKVGAYMQTFSGIAGFTAGGIGGAIAGAIITNPNSIKNILLHYGASKNYVSNVMNKVKNGIKLSSSESGTLSKILNSEVIADKVDKVANKLGVKMNFMPEGNKSIINKQKDVKIYKLDVGEIPEKEFKIFKEKIQKGEKPKIIFNKVSQKTKELLESNGISGIKGHQIDYNIIHIYKRHGEKSKLSKGELPVTDDDLRKIPKIVLNPDNVKLSPNLSGNGEKIIIYEKVMDNKYYYLEYIPKKGKLLKPKTMYINKL